jgi:hypothetical protein
LKINLLDFETWVSNKNQILNQGDFENENKEFEILLPGFGFKLSLILIRMKANTFYSHYKSKAIHQYKKMHGGMNAGYNYI